MTQINWMLQYEHSRSALEANPCKFGLIGADGRCKTPAGSSVEMPAATFTNTIGDAILAAHWTEAKSLVPPRGSRI